MSYRSTPERSPPPPLNANSTRLMTEQDFRNLTDDEVCQIFSLDGYDILEPFPMSLTGTDAGMSPSDDLTIASLEPTVSVDNELYLCKSACVSADKRFLVSPNLCWQYGYKNQSALYIREAYKEHWDIIYDHFAVKKKYKERVIISGTPGGGKSVEGLFLLHKIFETTPDNSPPILYAATAESDVSLAHVRGMFFAIDDHAKFQTKKAYKVMRAHGAIWHVYDSSVPSNRPGWKHYGPVIIISSPGRASKDLKIVGKIPCLILYLPLPSVEEMHVMRDHLFDDKTDDAYLSANKMLSLTEKYGCVPRTVFDFGNHAEHLKELEAHLKNIANVERLLTMVGSSVIDHDVASGKYVHIVPYVRPSFDAEEHYDKNPMKRSAGDADLEQTGLSKSERITFLKEKYKTIIYMWASDYIRDLAFEAFLKFTPDRMMSIILSRPETSVGGFPGLILEPFVNKLLNESGVIGRMRDLETGKEMGKTRLGPWRTKNVYFNHSQVKPDKDVYNLPHKREEGAIDSLVPYDGYCFQVTVSDRHGINRPALDALMQKNIFADFCRRKRSKPVQFVFIVEAAVYDKFRKPFHGKNKESYKIPSLRDNYPGLVQRVFEIDMRSVYQFHEAHKTDGAIDMTKQKTLTKIQNAVQRRTFGESVDVKEASST